ncbi:MAG: HNH endonuclease [Deltaproteobacteria bacterium]|nr:HNH endonuclease [Deltaproteobacteria bacterium]
MRKVALEHDKNTCQFCGHVAKRNMNVHHLNKTGENSAENLINCCVARHAVMRVGRNLSVATIEVWESEMSQVEIFETAREGVKNGKTLKAINTAFHLKKGSYDPGSIGYANSLVATIGGNPRTN